MLSAPIHHHICAFELRTYFDSFVGLTLAYNAVLLFVEDTGVYLGFVLPVLLLNQSIENTALPVLLIKKAVVHEASILLHVLLRIIVLTANSWKCRCSYWDVKRWPRRLVLAYHPSLVHLPLSYNFKYNSTLWSNR